MSLVAVLLGGGAAQRLGMPKGLVRVGGVRLLELQAQRLAAAGVTQAALTLGPNREAYVEQWPELEQPSVVFHGVQLAIVEDARSRFGPFGSLVAAIETLRAHDWERLFVLPLDIPCAKAEVIARLTDVCAEAVVPRYDGKGGHPVLLSRRLAERLLVRNPETSRLDELLRSLAAGERIDVAVDDPTVVVDLNTPEAVAGFVGGAG